MGALLEAPMHTFEGVALYSASQRETSTGKWRSVSFPFMCCGTSPNG